MAAHDITTGLAIIYYAMPSAPSSPDAAGVKEWQEIIEAAATNCNNLEAEGWEGRWADNSDNEFAEIAYERRYSSLDDAMYVLRKLAIGLDPVWHDDDGGITYP